MVFPWCKISSAAIVVILFLNEDDKERFFCPLDEASVIMLQFTPLEPRLSLVYFSSSFVTVEVK